MEGVTQGSFWQRGLSEYDGMEGIAWEWQSIDGCMNKAPMAQESSGRNPTDRGKKRNKAPYPSWTGVASRYRSSPPGECPENCVNAPG